MTPSFVSLVDFVSFVTFVSFVVPFFLMAMVNVNGRISDGKDAVISVFDHGFLFGEGIYETLRTYRGQPFLFDRHMRRLRRSAALIDLALPLSDAQIAARFDETMRAANMGPRPGSGREAVPEAYIRLLVTRGSGDLTYDPVATPEPSFVVIVKPQIDLAPAVYETGVKVALVQVVRNHPDTVNPLIKSNNLMNSALAMQEAVRRGAFEGLMRNYRGELAELSTANIFIVKNGAALTPPLDSGLLPGITREFLFEVGADAGIPVKEQVLKDPDLFGADEAFLTSTTREIVPIVKVDERTIGDGRPGPVTNALLQHFRRKALELTEVAAGARET